MNLIEKFRTDANLQRASRGTVGHILSMLFVVWEPLVFHGSCSVPVYHLIAAGVGAADLQLGATIRCCLVMFWGSLIGSLFGLIILAISGPSKIASVLLMLLTSIPLSSTKLSHTIALFSVNSQMAISSVVVKSPEDWLTWNTVLEFGLPPVYSNTIACIITFMTSLLIFPRLAESDLQQELSNYVRDIGIMLSDFASRMLSKGGIGEHAPVSYTEKEFMSRIGVRPRPAQSIAEKNVQAKSQLLRKVNVGFSKLDVLMAHLIYEPLSSTHDEWFPVIKKSKVLLDHVFVLMMTLDGFSSRLCSDDTIEHWWGSMLDVWLDNFGKCISGINVISQIISTLHKSTMSQEAHEKLLEECKILVESINELVGTIGAGFMNSFQSNLRRLNYLSDPTPPWELRLLYFTTFYFSKTRNAVLDLAKEVVKYHQKIRESPSGCLEGIITKSYVRMEEMTEIQGYVSPKDKRDVFSHNYHLYTLDLFLEPFRMWKTGLASFPLNKAQLNTVMANDKVRFLLKHTLALSIVALPLVFTPESVRHLFLHWIGIWAYVTVFLVFQKAVELTFVKGLLSILATVPAAVIGGMYLLSEHAASQALLVCLFLAPWTFLGLYFCRGIYHYGAFIFVMTIPLVIGCQFDPDEYVANWTFPAARCTSIIYGSFVALLVNQFIWPFWGVNGVREKLADSMEMIGELFTLITRLYESGKSTDVSLDEETHGKIERMFTRINNLLDQAQGMSSKDTSLLRNSGAMHLPQEYKSIMESQRMLLVYLQVLHACVSRDPLITGKYSGNIDNVYMNPLAHQMDEIRQYFEKACKLIAVIVRPTSSHGFILHFDHYTQEPMNFTDILALFRLMDDFREARRHTVTAINNRRQQVLENWAEALSERDRKMEEMEKGHSDIRVVRRTGPRIPFHADDSLRFFAYIYAKSSTLDTIFEITDQLFSAEHRLSKSPRTPPTHSQAPQPPQESPSS